MHIIHLHTPACLRVCVCRREGERERGGRVAELTFQQSRLFDVCTSGLVRKHLHCWKCKIYVRRSCDRGNAPLFMHTIIITVLIVYYDFQLCWNNCKLLPICKTVNGATATNIGNDSSFTYFPSCSSPGPSAPFGSEAVNVILSHHTKPIGIEKQCQGTTISFKPNYSSEYCRI